MSESLIEWALRLSNLKSLDLISISEFVGFDIEFEESMKEDDWCLFLLYFIVKKRSFENKKLNKKDILFIKILKSEIENIFKTLEFSKKKIFNFYEKI